MDRNTKSAKKSVTDNNNPPRIEEQSRSAGSANNECDDDEEFVERYLTVASMSFSILPNGGTGDCLFKAISQAIFEGDESEHLPIRQQVVSFIAEKTWEKYQMSVQVQHINGHNNLQKSWDENPIEAYKNYMLEPGTLGSFLELNAAGELYQFNFASIQEYNDSIGVTYRVENSRQFPNKRVPMHYFLFTGDFDNGHWEYLKNCRRRDRVGELVDGTYNGTLDIVIEGQVSSVEFWLMENTQIGQIEYDDVAQSTFLRKRSKYPFDCPLLRFESDKTVELIDISYVITPSKYSDLFSVLANSHLRNEGLAKEMHDLLTTYRNNNFSQLNYKLITQPQSHGFTTEVLKYASMPYKGNIQDLLSAADLYGFSFTIYLILTNVIHLCKFIHVDRWGSEVNTMEYFFINMVPSVLSNRTKVCAHWYHLVPVKALSYDPPEKYKNSKINTLKKQKSEREVDCEKLAAAINLENKKYIKNKAKDLYNLYFDRQLNPPNDDGGDSSIKQTNIQESEIIHSKELQQKVRKKATTIIEGTSQMIEMKPNVVYRYGAMNSKSLNQNQSTDGENPNQINKNKSHHSMKKVSSQDLRMTPSNLLYARSSFTFNGLDRKTNKPVQNLEAESNTKESRETVQDASKPGIYSRSIAGSTIYNKIVFEHNINSTNVSSAGSLKSLKSFANDNHSVVSYRSDSNRDLSGDDTRKTEDTVLIGNDVRQAHSQRSIQSDDLGNDLIKCAEKTSRKNSYTVSKRDSKSSGKNSHVIRGNDSEMVEGKDSYVINGKDSNKVRIKHSNHTKKVISDISETDSENINRKNSRPTSRKDSNAISGIASNTISRRNSRPISGKDSRPISRKDSNDISRKDSDAINEKHLDSISENNVDPIITKDSDHSIRKDSDHKSGENFNHVTRKDFNHISTNDSGHMSTKDSGHMSKKDSGHMSKKDSGHMKKNDSGHMSKKDSDHMSRQDLDHNSRKNSDAISRKDSDAIRRKDLNDASKKICDTTLKDSNEIERKDSNNISGICSYNICRKCSNAIIRKYSDNICRQCSENPCKKGSENICKKGSENISTKGSENICKKNSENICKKNSENICKKNSENICKKNSENICRKCSDAINRKYSNALSGKYSDTSINNSDSSSRKYSEKFSVLSNNSRKISDVSTKFSDDMNTKDADAISRKESNDMSRKGSRKIRKGSADENEENWDGISKNGSDNMARTESDDINNEDWKKSNEKYLEETRNNKKESRKASRKHLESTSRNDLGKISRKHSKKICRNSSGTVTEKIKRRKPVKVKRRQSKKVDENKMDQKEKDEELVRPTSDVSSSCYCESEVHSNNDNISESNTSYNPTEKDSVVSYTTNNSNISTNKRRSRNLDISSSAPPQSRARTASGHSSTDTDCVTNSSHKECEQWDSSNSDVEGDLGDLCAKYYQHQLAIRKSEGEMLAKQKAATKTTERSLSERVALLAKDSLSKFFKNKQSKIKPAKYSFCDNNNNFSEKHGTLVKNGNDVITNLVISSIPPNPNLSIASIVSGQDKPFMRSVVQERMRKESVQTGADESVQTIRPSSNSSRNGHNRQSQFKQPGCLRQVCRAIGSCCTCSTKKET